MEIINELKTAENEFHSAVEIEGNDSLGAD